MLGRTALITILSSSFTKLINPAGDYDIYIPMHYSQTSMAFKNNGTIKLLNQKIIKRAAKFSCDNLQALVIYSLEVQ